MLDPITPWAESDPSIQQVFLFALAKVLAQIDGRLFPVLPFEAEEILSQISAQFETDSIAHEFSEQQIAAVLRDVERLKVLVVHFRSADF